MRSLGVVQKDVATWLSTSQSRVSEALNGRAELAPRERQILSDKLGFPSDYLFSHTSLGSSGNIPTRSEMGEALASVSDAHLRVISSFRRGPISQDPCLLLEKIRREQGYARYAAATAVLLEVLRRRLGTRSGVHISIKICQPTQSAPMMLAVDFSPRPGADVISSFSAPGVLHPIEQNQTGGQVDGTSIR